MKREFDKNMIVEKAATRPGIKYYSIDEDIFDIRGVFRENGVFVRMPKAVAERVSAGIAHGASHNAGGRVRFMTDSPYVAVSVKVTRIYQIPIMTLAGTCGIDVYADGDFCGLIRPNADDPQLHISAIVNMRSGGEHLIEINFPLYSGVEEMMIGIDQNATLKAAPKYTYDKPIVFYGSSITNGACSTRPGFAYSSRLSRMLDADYINLGFGGLCKGEPAMIDYIASLDMSAFVLDYDHNAPDVAHLERTHENAYLTVRKSNPTLPIIIISSPRCDLSGDWGERLEVIKRTYDNAIKAGDKNVYFINGSEFFPEIGYDFSIDGIHPTDLGFDIMAKAILSVLKKALK